MSGPVRSLFPIVGAALLGTALLDVWLRARPVAMPTTTQVVSSVAVFVAVAAVVALARHVERDAEDQ
jgi:hypothetical protein